MPVKAISWQPANRWWILKQRASKPASGAGSRKKQKAPAAKSKDAGTVVGNMPTSDDVMVETATRRQPQEPRRSAGRVKAAPAVRALAKRLGVDLSAVLATAAATGW